MKYTIALFALVAAARVWGQESGAAPSTVTAAGMATTTAVAPVENPGALFLRQVERRQFEARAPGGELYLTGQFAQVRRSPLFIDDVHTTGQFHVLCVGLAPDAPYYARFDTVIAHRGRQGPPIQSTWWFRDATSYVYAPGVNQVTVRSWDAGDNPVKHMNHLLLGLIARADDILKFYEAELVEPPDGQHTRLRLQPWFSEQLGGVEVLLVDFDNQTLYHSHVFCREQSGNQADITIWDVQAHRAAPADAQADQLFRPAIANAARFADQ